MTIDVSSPAGRWAAVLPHRGRLVRLARAKLGHNALAEDLAHDALVRVVEMKADLRPDQVPGLLTVTLDNLVKNEHRKSARGSLATQRWRGQQDLLTHPDTAVEDQDEAQWLAGQTSQLSERDRRVLLARASGQSTAQAAATLGVTRKSVESSFTRSRGRLTMLWRATLTVLAAVLNRRSLRIVKAAAPALAAAVLLTPWSPLGTAPAKASPATAPTHSPALTISGTPTPQRAIAASGAATTVTPTRTQQPTLGNRNRNPRRTPDGRRLLTVTLPDVGPLRPTDQATVERDHGNETLTQTVERCLRDGIEVTPTETDCRG